MGMAASSWRKAGKSGSSTKRPLGAVDESFSEMRNRNCASFASRMAEVENRRYLILHGFASYTHAREVETSVKDFFIRLVFP